MLQVWPVSRRVNTPRHNDAHLLDRAPDAPHVIDVAPAGAIARAVASFNRTPFYKLALWVIFLGFFLPWLIIIVPIVVMAALDINPG